MPKQQLAVPQLPTEIIADILSRLPVKFLMQNKCVSKPWRSLISSPGFARLHLQRVLRDPSLDHHKFFITSIPFLSIDPEGCVDETLLSFPSRMEGIEADFNIFKTQLNFEMQMPENDVDLVGSCNGLVCVVLDSQRLLVLNPSTRQARELQLPNSFLEGEYYSGFGFDSGVDDYKVVLGGLGDRVEIFNLKGNNWRTIQEFQSISEEPSGAGVFSNGVLHWIVGLQNQTCAVLRFDFAEEKFLPMMELPDQIRKLGFLSGELKLVRNYLCVSTEYHAPKFEAWVMKEYGDNASWTKLVSFNPDTLPGCEYWNDFLWVTRTGHAIFIRDGWFTVVFDPKEDRGKEIWIPSEWDSCKAIMYMESLISPY